jgi:hypothetical protein
MGAAQRDPRQLVEAGQTFLPVPPQPFANRFGGHGKDPRRGFDAMDQGMLDHA